MIVEHSVSTAGGTDAVFVFRPKLLRTGRPLVIYAHGYGGSAAGLMTLEFGQRELAERYGIPTISTDLAGDSWGAAVESRIPNVLSYMATKYGCDVTRVAFIAESMGNFTAWPFLAENPTVVKAVASILPANDLVAFHANPTYAASIDAAYGGTADSTEIAAHDPNQMLPAIRAAIGSKPAQFWYSTNDPVVDPAGVQAFAAAISDTPDMRSLGAVGHTPTGVVPATVAATLARGLS